MFGLSLGPRGKRVVIVLAGSRVHILYGRPPLPSKGWSLVFSSYIKLSGSWGDLSEPLLTLTSWFVLVLPQKHYFPINYRVSVPYEGVLRMANITRLQRARVSQQELRYLWVWVSLSATESVQEVLLEGHPSWKYLEDVHTLLLDVQQSLTDVEVGPKVEAVVSLLSAPRLSLKLVRPKALLDNCFRVMELLYCSCCKQSSVLNWQDCEVPSPQHHSPEPSSQCVAAQLYPLSQSPPISLPRSPRSKPGAPAP
uniref:Interleukin-34 n=2 Tax=Canis lupus TaxID=9612 RepID=A0A8P0P771_CANLF